MSEKRLVGCFEREDGQVLEVWEADISLRRGRIQTIVYHCRLLRGHYPSFNSEHVVAYGRYMVERLEATIEDAAEAAMRFGRDYGETITDAEARALELYVRERLAASSRL